jgi:hypothetical protein
MEKASSSKDTKINMDKLESTPDEAANMATENANNRATLRAVEGLALVMLCSCRPIVRKRAVSMLKDVRNLFNLLDIPKVKKL